MFLIHSYVSVLVLVSHSLLLSTDVVESQSLSLDGRASSMPGLWERTEGLAWYHGLRHAITPALVMSVSYVMCVVRVARTFPRRHSGGMNTRRLDTAPCTLSFPLLGLETAFMSNLHNKCEKRSLPLCLTLYNSNASFVSSFLDTLNSVLMPL